MTLKEKKCNGKKPRWGGEVGGLFFLEDQAKAFLGRLQEKGGAG